MSDTMQCGEAYDHDPNELGVCRCCDMELDAPLRMPDDSPDAAVCLRVGPAMAGEVLRCRRPVGHDGEHLAHELYNTAGWR